MTRPSNRIAPVALVLLRFAIGWHFLYEGLTKLLTTGWSAAPFLTASQGFAAGFFKWIAANPALMTWVDLLNVYGLMLIGLGLCLGLITRVAAWSGVVLLVFYYLAYPPFGADLSLIPAEGSYFVVSKNLVEALALVLIARLRAGRYYGFDSLIAGRKRPTELRVSQPELPAQPMQPQDEMPNPRRDFIKAMTTLPALGGLACTGILNIMDTQVDGMSGSTIKLEKYELSDIKGKLPVGKMGRFEMSRLVMGCNLIGGWAHARDLIYANKLFRAYNTPEKVMQTLHLAEQAGINTMFAVTPYFPLINRYKKLYDGKMQTICQAGLPEDDFFSDIDKAIDEGTDMIYIQGANAERYVKNGRTEDLGKALDYIRKQGYTAGLGTHSIQVFIECAKLGIYPDFYVKTFHHDNYWSAHPPENRIEFSVDGERSGDHNHFHDNIFDLFPGQTIDFMARTDIPWFAFKVLAAGAIRPSDGFRYAFENGADHICVGMFDFQVIENVNTTLDVLNSPLNRTRGWKT